MKGLLLIARENVLEICFSGPHIYTYIIVHLDTLQDEQQFLIQEHRGTFGHIGSPQHVHLLQEQVPEQGQSGQEGDPQSQQ